MGILRIKNLTLHLGSATLLENITLQAASGNLSAILAPNGSGKTSLMRVIIGYAKPQNGTIYFEHEGESYDLLTLSAHKRAQILSFIPQNSTFSFHYSLWEFVLLGLNTHLRWYETPGKHLRQKTLSLLERLNIAHLKDKAMHLLSGGEKQMAALARALLQDSQILLLDEPTAWLDVKNQAVFFHVLKQQIREKNLCALMNIHDPQLVYHHADFLYLIKNGRNFTSGRVADTLTSPNLSALYEIPIDVRFLQEGILLNSHGGKL